MILNERPKNQFKMRVDSNELMDDVKALLGEYGLYLTHRTCSLGLSFFIIYEYGDPTCIYQPTGYSLPCDYKLSSYPEMQTIDDLRVFLAEAATAYHVSLVVDGVSLNKEQMQSFIEGLAISGVK